MSKLVVLRGPSAAGKSTVAQILHSIVVNKTALIEQDYYRHVMFNNLHTDLEAPRYVMFAAISTALEHGYDVILEGFMGMGKYKTYFDALLASHPHDNYFFYFDIPFEETLHRHATRQKSETLNKSRMRELFLRSGPSGYDNEVTLHSSTAPTDAALFIAETCRLQLSKRSL